MTWQYADIERLLDEFIGPSDPADPKTRKRLRIVDAATQLFIKQGYRKTSVDEIADRAAVAKGTVYLYFKNKLDLLLAAIAMEKREHLSRLKPILTEDLDPRDRLKQYLKTVLVVANEMPLMSRLLTGDHELMTVLAELPEQLVSENDEMRVQFMGELVDGAAGPHHWNAIELEDRVRVLIGLGFFAGSLANEQVRGGLSIERFATILADLVVDGLGPRNSQMRGER